MTASYDFTEPRFVPGVGLVDPTADTKKKTKVAAIEADIAAEQAEIAEVEETPETPGDAN